MNQPTLFDQPKVRHTDPPTSRDAADSLDRQAVGKRCAELLKLVRHAGTYGRTVAELVAVTGYDRGNTARRVTDLAQAGKVYDSGKTRPGPSGRQSIVWVSVTV
jgi:hypothetical protein